MYNLKVKVFIPSLVFLSKDNIQTLCIYKHIYLYEWEHICVTYFFHLAMDLRFNST